ncbi:hypothetical protein N182_37255 [Sinorhizobium sp. GL2]|nr:hypothetical protein N182_37255 [Sinorhizobium sp. GL2]
MLSPTGQTGHLISQIVEDVRLDEAAKPVVSRANGLGYRILVVDDEPVNVQVLVNHLLLAALSECEPT